MMCMSTPRRYAPQPVLYCPHYQHLAQWTLTLYPSPMRDDEAPQDLIRERAARLAFRVRPEALMLLSDVRPETPIIWERLTSIEETSTSTSESLVAPPQRASTLTFRQVSGPKLTCSSDDPISSGSSPSLSVTVSPGWSIAVNFAGQEPAESDRSSDASFSFSPVRDHTLGWIDLSAPSMRSHPLNVKHLEQQIRDAWRVELTHL